MKTTHLTPVRLRLILVGCLLLLIAIGITLFIVGNGMIRKYSQEAQAVAATAEAGGTTVQDLQKTKLLLSQNADTVKRASQIVAESTSYVYQDQIINDINNFATSAGLVVTSITFADTKVAATAATPAPTAGATTPGTAAATPAAPTGVKSTTASVTLRNPVDYGALLKFIHSVQSGLFKMRISEVSLSPASGSKNSNEVTSNVLNIEVYIR